MNSNAKGKRGERECAADHLEHWGVEARRGQQFAGGTDSPDVVTSLVGCHCEAKRVEKGNPYDWIEQAVEDADGCIPYVWHKRNNKPALLIVRFADFPSLARAWALHEKSRLSAAE